MAEAAAIFGTAVSALDLLAMAVKIFRRYQDYIETGHTVPKSLQNVANTIPYLRKSLERHAQAEEEALKNGNVPELDAAFAECRVILGRLEKFIDELIPAPDAGRLERMKKTIKSVRQESELKRVQDELHTQISALSYDALSKIATHRCIEKPIDLFNTIHNAPLRPSYGIPTSKVSKFIGREKIVKNVVQDLISDSTSREVVVLQGMGGQGKTQIALEVCDVPEIRQHFCIVLWINAATKDAAAQAFEHTAQAMCQKGSSFSDPQSKIDFVRERIEDLDKPCLLVFDNYDDLAAFKDIRSLFPRGNRHSILITSRHEDSTHLGRSMCIPEMNQKESVALLLHRSDLGHSQDNTRHAKEIGKHLGHLPLAIAQAGAYIKYKRIPLSAFIGHYDKRAASVLKQIPEIWEYGTSVFTTWEMSMAQYSHSQEERDKVDRMLLLLAILHHETINEKYFGHLLECLPEPPSWTAIFETHGRWDSSKLQDVLTKLARLSLLQIVNWSSSHYTISIHPMISDWLKLRIGTHQLVEAVTEATGIVASFIERKPSRQLNFEFQREVHVYIESLKENYSSLQRSADLSPLDRISLRSPTTMECLLTFAGFHANTGRFSMATTLYDSCIRVYDDLLGTQDPRTIRAVTLQADFQLKHGDAAKAASLYERLLAQSDKQCSVKLATCCMKSGMHAEARQKYQKALAELEMDAEHNALQIIDCRVQMTLNESKLSSCDVVGPLNEALRVLDEWFSGQGEEDPRLDKTVAELQLGILWELGLLCFEAEDFLNAEKLYLRAVELSEQLLGAENGDTLSLTQNLAVVYNLQSKYQESEKWYQRTLDGFEAHYGAESEPTLKLCHCYGHVLGSQFRNLEATNLMLRAINGLQELHGPGNDLVTSFFDCLTETYVAIGDKLEAENLYKKGLTDRVEALGAYDERTVDVILALGKHYANERRFDEAEDYLRQANDRYYNLFGSDEKDVKTWESMEALYEVLFIMGRLEEAGGLCEDLLCAREKHYKNDIHILDIAHNLSEILHQLGKWEEMDAIHLHYGKAFDTVVDQVNQENSDMDVEETDSGQEETGTSKDLVALELQPSNDSDASNRDKTSTDPCTPESQAPRPRNCFLDDDGNLRRLIGSYRVQAKKTIRDYMTPGNTTFVTFYPYMTSDN